MSLPLFVSVLAWSAAVNGQLFWNIISGDSLTAPQCSQVEIQFGGGVEPYSFYVYSYYADAYVYDIFTDSPGTMLWTLERVPETVLYLYVVDATGMSLLSHYFQIEPGNTNCLNEPPWQRAVQVPVSVIATPTPSAQLPTISNTPGDTPAPGTTTTGTTTQLGGQRGTTTPAPFGGGGGTALPALDDCVSAATCSFNPTSTGPTYPQQTQIGAAFDNCDSSIAVHNIFSGSITVTDNWSVDVGVSFGIPRLLGLDVHTTVEHGKEVTMSQTYDYYIPPQLRVQLWTNKVHKLTVAQSGIIQDSNLIFLDADLLKEFKKHTPKFFLREIAGGQIFGPDPNLRIVI
ncbi:hypothetical protein MVEN_00003100 [Mycena venus]|uniref:Secreted protein n=1 Tax=Mycena venus TaxID=2733690 RepID=A0A8H7DEJ7_9AGAR|nr:hypothetical protein MVEN_00003100 [Mycena venus]